jgi:hypothetical protein
MGVTSMSGTKLLRPQDLVKISDDTEMAKVRQALESKRKKEQEERELHDSFMSQDVRPDAAERVMAVVRRAAEAGQREVLALRFPATFCNDHGRAINNLDPNWPDSLEGFAKRAHAWYMEHLEPLGFKVRAQILNYPDGIPGEVGIFLRW